MDFWNNVENILKTQDKLSHGWKKRLGMLTGIKEETIKTQWSRKSVPRADDALRIARALGTTVEALVEGDISQTPSDSLYSAISTAKQAEKALKAVAANLRVSLSEIDKATTPSNSTYTPAPAYTAAPPTPNPSDWYPEDVDHIVLPDCDVIAAGDPIPPIVDPERQYLIPTTDLPSYTTAKTHGVFRIKGTSMTDAGIPHGAIVLIKWNPEPRSNTVALVYRKHTDGCTLKLLKKLKHKWCISWQDGSGKTALLDPDDRVIGSYTRTLKHWRKK